MAVNTPFFSKREPQIFNARTPTTTTGLSSTLQTASNPALSESASPATSMGIAAPATSSVIGEAAGGSKLTVGPNIKLKGVEITDCDTLVVEGTVEATMDSRVIHIAEQGAFHGSAEVDIAEIHGEFTGSLTVRQKLIIHSSGKVSGKVRYGKIVMEEGSQLSGEVMFGTQAWPKKTQSDKTKDASSNAAGHVASIGSASGATPVALAAAL
jgi:cytoskeletal protein CcmA (bactofilin family)